MKDREFWASTPCEIDALRAVWLEEIDRQNYMHASIQATLYNAHFKTDGVDYTAEDLLGRGDRQDRQKKSMADKIATARIKRGVQAMEKAG